jgi:hypothetical protein
VKNNENFTRELIRMEIDISSEKWVVEVKALQGKFRIFPATESDEITYRRVATLLCHAFLKVAPKIPDSLEKILLDKRI